MSRILIAIGCNLYQDSELSDLTGAENDARCIFEKLVNEQLGKFDKSRSKLLLSPTLADVNSAIGEVLFNNVSIDCLTLFYAGHGGVKDGTYFLMCRDSKLEQLSLTALSTSSLFSYLNEAKCGHTNIVIDSCQSGGIIHDLGSLLKPEVIGKSGAISVSILVAAASDQSAREKNGQGNCTKSVLQCISGEIDIPSLHPTLDLMEIGQAIAPLVAQKLGQNPEYWGISLKGHVPLCINPNKQGGGKSKTLLDFSTGFKSNIRNILDRHANNVWTQYFALDEFSDTKQQLELFRNCVTALNEHPSEAVEFIRSINSAFRQKLAADYTGFDEAELTGAALTSIIHLYGSSQAIDSTIRDMCRDINELVIKGIKQLNSRMSDDKYHLLSNGMAEYFYLPIRISKILGWLGISAKIAQVMGYEYPIEDLKRLLTKVIEDYSTSIFSVSDTQAPYLANFVSAAEDCDYIDQAETVTSLLFNSFLQTKGRIASHEIADDQIVKYLISTTGTEIGELDRAAIAQPSELLALFFVLYACFDMSNELDLCLAEIDHCHFNFYIPDEYKQFGLERIPGGQNYTFQVGHGVWKTADLSASWSEIRMHIASDEKISDPTVKLCAQVASQIVADRTPWCLYSELEL